MHSNNDNSVKHSYFQMKLYEITCNSFHTEQRHEIHPRNNNLLVASQLSFVI